MAFNIAAPKGHDDTTAAYFLSPGSGSGSSITRYRLDISASSPASDTLTTTAAISIPAWSAAPNAAQPNGQTVDSLDGRFQSNTIQRDGMLWNVHAVSVGGYARWRLYEISLTGTSPAFTLTPTTSQFANVDHLFNPSVAVNSTNAFVTSSRTAPSGGTNGYVAMLIFNGPRDASNGWDYDLIFTSLYQYSDSGFGTTCSNWAPRYTCRWGDYSATQIDPVDNSRAWGFNQLITGTSQFNWTTRAASVVGTSVPPGVLSVTPNSTLNLTGPVGGPFTSNYSQFTLTNTGSGSLNYSISPPSWLTVSPSSSGSLAGGASTSVTVSAGSSANTMGAGNYSSTIIFTNTTNGSGNTSVATNLVVYSPAAGVLAVSPNTPLNFNGSVGGPFASDMPGQFTLSNTGSASFNYSISPPNWLDVSASSGSLAVGASVVVVVFPGPAAVGAIAGNYASTIIFTNTTNGSGSTSVVTNLLVTQPPGGALDANDNGRSNGMPDAVAGINRPPQLPPGQ